MSTPNWQGRFRRGLLGLALAVLLGWGLSASADVRLQPDDAKVARAADALATRLDRANVDIACFVETHLGFPPMDAHFDAYEWRALPPRLQLRVVLAITRPPGSESQGRALALLSRALAQQDPGVRTVPELQDYLNLEVPRGQRPGFQLPERPARPKLSAGERRHVGELAAALRRPGHGGPFNALRTHFGLSQEAAAALWLEAGSSERAVELQISRTRVEERPALLLRMTEQVARVEPALRRFLPGNPGDTPPAAALTLRPSGDPPPTLKDAKGPTPLTDLTREQEFRRFLDREYPDPQDRQFRRMRDSRHGVGGILFGSPVRGDPRLPRLLSVRYELPGKGPDDGVLVFRFADKTELRLAPVHPEDARAAHRLVYAARDQGAEAGYPLLGLQETTPYFEIGPRAVVRGKRSDVSMDPALHNTDLGWAALKIDSLPESRGWLFDEFERDEALRDPEQKRFARQSADWLFDAWYHARRQPVRYRVSVYRMVDVPMRVEAGDGRLVILRDEGGASRWPESLRRTAFLEMRLLAFPEDEKAAPVSFPRLTEESYRAIPELLRSSYEFRRLNNFAAVLAAVRWARAQGAEFARPNPLAPAQPPITPDAVVVVGKAIRAIPRSEPKTDLAGNLKQIDARQAELVKSREVRDYLRMVMEFATAARDLEDTPVSGPKEEEVLKAVRAAGARLTKAARGSEEVRYFLELGQLRPEIERSLTGLGAKALLEEETVKAYRKVERSWQMARDAFRRAPLKSPEEEAALKEMAKLEAVMRQRGKDSPKVRDYRALQEALFRSELKEVEAKLDLQELSADVAAYRRLARVLVKARKELAAAAKGGEEEKAALKLVESLQTSLGRLRREAAEVGEYERLLVVGATIRADLRRVSPADDN